MIFSEINAAWDILKKCKNLFKNKGRSSADKVTFLKSSLVQRFVTIFESHGVHRNQIPRFFGHGITIADVQSDEALLDKLSEQILDAVCVLFVIRREWLDGADEQVYELRDFYKHPQDFERFILSLKPDNGKLAGCLVSLEFCKAHAEDGVIVLSEEIDWIGEKTIYRYYLCNNWYMTYWKSKADLAVCIAIAWKNNVYVHGTVVNKSQFLVFAEGKALLDYGHWGAIPPNGKNWDPEYMSLDPVVFLEGVKPEEDNSGHYDALKQWLEYAEQGLMDIGVEPVNIEPFKPKMLSVYDID